jgi:hypothetical protein
VGVKGAAGWKEGEMTQTLYAHTNKRKKTANKKSEIIDI